MNNLIKPLLLLTILLGACSPSISSPEVVPAIGDTATSVPYPDTDPSSESSNPEIIVTVETPGIGLPPDGDIPTPSTAQQDCGYQWAYNNLPELTEQLDQRVKSLNPNSVSRATAFGENCVALDGQIVKFLAMETDFYVIIPVADLNDHEAFGNWIAQVMQVVNAFPPDMLAGPNPGFVEFRFEKSQSESAGIRVSIRQYNETANGKTGEDLFRMFYTKP